MDDEKPPESDGEADDQASSRERAFDAREHEIRRREVFQGERTEQVAKVLDEADVRDDEADARDWIASQRDMTANMQAWMNDNDNHDDAETRQAALDDRLHSADDRHSAAVDRRILTEDPDPQQSQHSE